MKLCPHCNSRTEHAVRGENAGPCPFCAATATYSTGNAAPTSLTFDELASLVRDLEALRPPRMSEGEMMRLVKYAYDMGARDGERRGRK